MRLSSLTHLGFEVNCILDSNPGSDLTFQEVHNAAREKSIIKLLQDRYADYVDLSLFESGSEERREVEAALSLAAECLEGRERRKTGVENRGLCLIVALILEAIQQAFCPLKK